MFMALCFKKFTLTKCKSVGSTKVTQTQNSEILVECWWRYSWSSYNHLLKNLKKGSSVTKVVKEPGSLGLGHIKYIGFWMVDQGFWNEAHPALL